MCGRRWDAAVDTLCRRGLAVGEADPEWPPGTAEARILAIEDAGLADLFGAKWRAAPELFDPHVGWQIERGLGRSGAEVAAAHAFSLGIALDTARFFASWDLLLCPTTACVAWTADRLDPETLGGRPAAHRGHAAFTPLFNHARTPAVSIPCGAGKGGLPVGLRSSGLGWRTGASWRRRPGWNARWPKVNGTALADQPSLDWWKDHPAWPALSPATPYGMGR